MAVQCTGTSLFTLPILSCTALHLCLCYTVLHFSVLHCNVLYSVYYCTTVWPRSFLRGIRGGVEGGRLTRLKWDNKRLHYYINTVCTLCTVPYCTGLNWTVLYCSHELRNFANPRFNNFWCNQTNFSFEMEFYTILTELYCFISIHINTVF